MCLALGYPHPDVLLSCITAKQLVEWEAFDRLEPIGGFREDYRFAQVCYLIFDIAQAVYGKPGRRRKSSPIDFMPWGGLGAEKRQREGKKQQSVEEMKAILFQMFKPSKQRKKNESG